MLKRMMPLILMVCLSSLLALPATAGDHPKGGDHPQAGDHPKAAKAPTVEEQIAGMEKMCLETADARGKRQEEKSLHERLGGDEKIAQMFRNVLARHRVNESIKHTMDGVDDDMLVEHLVEFVSAGTGGGATYTGKSMPEAHRDMNLTDADFLAAGGDIVAAMQEMEYGQNEIDEFICILVSLKGQVVFK